MSLQDQSIERALDILEARQKAKGRGINRDRQKWRFNFICEELANGFDDATIAERLGMTKKEFSYSYLGPLMAGFKVNTPVQLVLTLIFGKHPKALEGNDQWKKLSP